MEYGEFLWSRFHRFSFRKKGIQLNVFSNPMHAIEAAYVIWLMHKVFVTIEFFDVKRGNKRFACGQHLFWSSTYFPITYITYNVYCKGVYGNKKKTARIIMKMLVLYILELKSIFTFTSVFLDISVECTIAFEECWRSNLNLVNMVYTI